MAGLHDTGVIDLVVEQPDGSALLVIVKEGEWQPKHDTPALKAKLNTYAQFVLDGGMASHYPQLSGRLVTIRVDSPDQPPESVTETLAVAGEKLQPYGISVTAAVNPRL